MLMELKYQRQREWIWTENLEVAIKEGFEMESLISRWLFSEREKRVLLGFLGECWVREREMGDKREIDSCRSQQIAALLKRRRMRFGTFLYDGCQVNSRGVGGGKG